MQQSIICLFLIAFTASVHAGPLRPTRQSVSKPPYRIDFVDDREGQPRPGNVRVLIRVSDARKNPTKPAAIHLTTAGNQVVKPTRRKDGQASSGDSSGLPPLTLAPRVSSYGGGLGIGINLNSLAGGGGPYSHTAVDFPAASFVRGSVLVISLRDGKSLTVPLTQFAQ